MTVLLWILNIALAGLFAWTGMLKATRPVEALTAMGWHWTASMPPAAIRSLGVAEVLGAAGLVLPLATGILPILTPIAATSLTAVMVGAIFLHARRREPTMQNVVVAVAALASAAVGFWHVIG